MTRRLWLTALVLLLAPVTARAQSAEVERRCTEKYPNMLQYYAWKNCVKTETQQEAEENVRWIEQNLKRQKEEAARPCIAADIARMEALASKGSAAINSEWTLEQAQAALLAILGYQGEITIPKDSIKDRVLVSSIDTKCGSSFHFLINIREGPDKKLHWYRTWAENAPTGYSAGLHQEFSVDFEDQRELLRRRADAAKRNEEFQARMAQQEQEREEERQKLLRSVKISDVKVNCLTAGVACSLDFVVTNVSKQPIKRISFGWMLRPPQMTECPKLATKQTNRQVLQPGERTSQSVVVNNTSGASDLRYCLSVTEIEFPYPWER